MKKVSNCLVWAFGFLFILGTSQSHADAMYIQLHKIPIADVARTLSKPNTKKDLQQLLTVAQAIKVETFTSRHLNPSTFDRRDFAEAMELKMQSQPKWNSKLSAESLSIINQHSDLLTETMGANSYGQAWFLKQRGQTIAANKMLQDLFQNKYTAIMQMRMQPFMQAPLSEIQFLRDALGSVNSPQEMQAVDSQLQKVKIHVSNLPPSNIQT
ncbi:MAG: hypothetical protein H0V66_06790 [Bdellovibrionales bacterium]|nr:hypothetical protein [Bdellovibrionales bacterium]